MSNDLKQCSSCGKIYDYEEEKCPFCGSSKYHNYFKAALVILLILLSFSMFGQHVKYVGNFSDEQLAKYKPIKKIEVVQKQSGCMSVYSHVNRYQNYVIFKRTVTFNKILNATDGWDVYKKVFYYAPNKISKFTNRRYNKLYPKM